MKPRRILTAEESCEILDEAVRHNALAVMNLYDPDEDQWHTFKSRFLERDPNRRFVVLDYQETHGSMPVPLSVGQYVGISFRYKSRKIMFASVVEAKGKFLTGPDESVAAIRYRWPESMTELQRRAYYRTPVPPELRVVANLWAGGTATRDTVQASALGILTGQSVDLSCGGTLIRLGQLQAPDWPDNQTLGVELHLPDGQPPLLLDAYYRGTRHDNEGALCVAAQFVGLELSPEGRSLLQRLARCVQRFHRMWLSKELRSRRARFGAG